MPAESVCNPAKHCCCERWSVLVLKQGPFLWLACGAALAISAFARWRLAAFADWGVDEAANLWLGTLLLRGGDLGLGLMSSRGLPNLAGAPLIAAPLSVLPDLIAVSRALSLLHLAALSLLALALARRTRALPIAIAALALHPAALLAAPNLWNQYLSLPIIAGTLALLVVVAELDERPALRAGAVTAVGALLLLGASVHLAGFADLAVLGALLLATLASRPRPVGGVVLIAGSTLVALFCGLLFAPWLAATVRFTPTRTTLLFCGGAVCFAAVVTLISSAQRNRFHRLLERIASSAVLAWAVPATLASCAWLSAVAVFSGAQQAARLLSAPDPWGLALLAAEAALVAISLPPVVGTIGDCIARTPLDEVLRKRCPGRERTAALLLAAAPLLVAARLALEPSLLSSGGRPDLLLPLFPVLAAPLVLCTATGHHRATPGIACYAVACLVVISFAIAGPTARFWQGNPYFIPPSEMRDAVDWMATRHRAAGGAATIDVGYDLLLGREWVAGACGPRASWYTVSRPFDWLFLRRHGLAAAREGTCRRMEGGDYLVRFRSAPRPPPGAAADFALRQITAHDVGVR